MTGLNVFLYDLDIPLSLRAHQDVTLQWSVENTSDDVILTWFAVLLSEDAELSPDDFVLQDFTWRLQPGETVVYGPPLPFFHTHFTIQPDVPIGDHTMGLFVAELDETRSADDPALRVGGRQDASATHAVSVLDGGQSFFGTTGDDVLEVAASATGSVFGFEGHDTLTAPAESDTIDIFGGPGNDIISGGVHVDAGDGFDSVTVYQAAEVFGRYGDDTIIGGRGTDTLYGGDGYDRIWGGANPGYVRESLFGGAGNDGLYGEAGFDHLDGGAGDDYLWGGDQADQLFGGDGDDRLLGGNGMDRLFGGSGDDDLSDEEGAGGFFGGPGHDRLSAFRNTADTRHFGGQGNDTIYGGAGDDVISGGAGFDSIWGDFGNDTMAGDFNADHFVFSSVHGMDVILDFDALNPYEKLDLSYIDAIAGLADLALEDPSGGAAQVQGSDVRIVTGEGSEILLIGVSLGDLDATDFIF